MLPHEIPTHLHGSPAVVAGCTWSQLFTLGGGAAGAFWAWQTLVLPQPIHTALCAVPAVVALVCAFWRPDGLGLLTWLGLVAGYLLMPHCLVWHREAASTVLNPLPTRLGDTTGGRAAPPRGVPFGPIRLSRPAGSQTTLSLSGAGVASSGRAERLVTPAAAARRRGSLLALLLGYRPFCLSTHHLRQVQQEKGT